MKTTNKMILAALICSASLFTSCKKGDPGTPGTNGTNGNANVQTTKFTTSSWVLSSSGKSYYYQYPISMPDKAAVMVYMDNGTGTYTALPFTLNDEEFIFINSASMLELDAISASGGTVTSNPGAISFKVVVIPPGMKKQDMPKTMSATN